MKQKNFILSYGTLRRGDETTPRNKNYNYERFGKGTQKFIKKLVISGFELYNLGPYPTITEGDGEITVELHEITDQKAMDYIDGMERGAGYLIKNIPVDSEDGEVTAKIYYMEKKKLNLDRVKKIESGDWCLS